jgi:D-3-phosphoglycerate dehydrogenase
LVVVIVSEQVLEATNLIKILVIPDRHLSKEKWTTCLKSALQEKYNEVDLAFYELKEAFSGWGVTYKGVKEFQGDPVEVAHTVQDAEILVVHFSPITKEVYEAGTRLKLIACARSTPLNIDVETATRNRIPVVYGAGRNADSVADFTMGILLAEIRHIARAFEALRRGTYPECRKQWRQFIPELRDRVLGIVGLGNIGRKVAERAKGFGLTILGCDPYVSEETMNKLGVVKTDLATLFKKSDFISIHIRLTPDTTGIIGEKELRLMKKTAFLVNTSRGAIIDEPALYQVLSEKRIAGAALDVFTKEPIFADTNNKFIQLDNVTVTPHLAGPSNEMFYRGASIVAEDIARFIRGADLVNVLNRDVL